MAGHVALGQGGQRLVPVLVLSRTDPPGKEHIGWLATLWQSVTDHPVQGGTLKQLWRALALRRYPRALQRACDLGSDERALSFQRAANHPIALRKRGLVEF